MRYYGLKPWDDNDCDEAVSMMKVLMAEATDEVWE